MFKWQKPFQITIVVLLIVLLRQLVQIEEMKTTCKNTEENVIHLMPEDDKQQTYSPPLLSQVRDPTFDFRSAMANMNRLKVDMDDPSLISLLRNYFIDLPSTLPYKLTHPEKQEKSNGQVPFVDSRLGYMRNGFYVECGALDGEKGSNSFFFEKVRGWQGVLIEANPDNYQMLKAKNRKSYTINACLNTKTNPAMVKFNKAYNLGKIIPEETLTQHGPHKRPVVYANPVEAQCLPLYSILLALNRTVVDYLSLDVEGDELDVLKTIPFHKVTIRFLSVEVAHGAGYGQIKKYMQKHGYEALLRVSRDDGGVNDVILGKKDMKY